MTARGKARKRALDILFEADQRHGDPLVTLAERQAEQDLVNPYTEVLVRGVAAELSGIDAVLGHASPEWPVDRMPSVDRTVLRIGVWELMYGDVPSAVAIDEAVMLVKDLSTDESPGFVNGVLAKVAVDHPRTAPR